MAKVLGKFQMGQFEGWKGITSDNHLGNIFKLEPQKLSNVMVELLALRRGKSLDYMLSKLPIRTFESDEDYTWDVVGSNRRNIPLLEARDEDGVVVTEASDNVGVNNAPFYLVFGEDWFADGEILFGHLNQAYPMRVLGEPRFEGSNAVYKVELMNGSNAGVPAERLLAGERFSHEYAPVEAEMSRKVGDIRFSTPVSMRNEFSIIRIQHKVAGNKLHKKLAIGLPIIKEVNGKIQKMVSNKWIHYVDYELEAQFSDYKNSVLAYGVSNRNSNGEYRNFGKSGNVIKQGDGLFAQIEAGNTNYYTRFSLEMIETALRELSTTKLDFGDRKFLLKTGEGGAMLLHKAILDHVSGWMPLISDGNPAVVGKTTSRLHSNALTAGFQFTEFKASNGVIVGIDVDPLYDDSVRNKIQHPLGGCAMSYRMDLCLVGNEGTPNIQKCAIKGQEDMRGIEWGLRDPYTGRVNNMHMSHDEDSATFHRMSYLGLVVYDPTKCISFIPAILQG